MNTCRGRDREKPTINVLIVNLLGMVAEIVEQTVQQQADMELLGSAENWEDVAAVAPRTDVIVLGADEVYPAPQSCLQILNAYPNLKILVLTTSNDEAVAYWRTLCWQQVQVISSQTMIESIRQIHLLPL